MTREELRATIEKAKKIVDSWPAWKRGILEQSGKPSFPLPRPQVDNFKDRSIAAPFNGWRNMSKCILMKCSDDLVTELSVMDEELNAVVDRLRRGRHLQPYQVRRVDDLMILEMESYSHLAELAGAPIDCSPCMVIEAVVMPYNEKYIRASFKAINEQLANGHVRVLKALT